MKIKTVLSLSAAAVGVAALLGYREAKRKRQAEPDPQPEQTLDSELEARMQEFMDHDRFPLFIQPVVELATGKVMGGEVLPRLDHPQHGLIYPDVFLKVVNRMNFQEDFDLYVFRKSCAWLSENRGMKSVSVNFSRKTLSRPRIAGLLAGIADEYDLEHADLVIEITEWEKEDHIEVYRENLRQLRELGFKIFLDDFGSGVTSIADLNQCDMDIVKIDRSVLLAAESADGGVILQTLIGMAAQLGVDVVCEGIETEQQEELVRSCGGHYVQGYRYYAPISAEELAEMLAE